MNLNACDEKPIINYPCFWEYKIIFESTENAKSIIEHIIGQREFELKQGQKSSHGKYESYSLKIFVDSQSDRLKLFEQFKEKAKFVI